MGASVDGDSDRALGIVQPFLSNVYNAWSCEIEGRGAVLYVNGALRARPCPSTAAVLLWSPGHVA
jgi:hypothetical protein